MCSVFKELLTCFMVNKYINTTELDKIDPFCSTYQLSNIEMYLGADVMKREQELTRQAIEGGQETTKSNSAILNDFKCRCRMFLQTACCEIKKRYNISDKLLSSVHIFTPKMAIDSNIRQSFPSLFFFHGHSSTMHGECYITPDD